MSDELDRRSADALADLRYHWDGAFHVNLDPAGKWTALSKLDPSAPPLIAATDGELRLMMRRAHERYLRVHPTDQGSL